MNQLRPLRCLSLLAIAAAWMITFPASASAAAPETFEVYHNSRDPYIEGKSIRRAELPKLARRSKAKSAILCADPELPRQ